MLIIIFIVNENQIENINGNINGNINERKNENIKKVNNKKLIRTIIDIFN